MLSMLRKSSISTNRVSRPGFSGMEILEERRLLSVTPIGEPVAVATGSVEGDGSYIGGSSVAIASNSLGEYVVAWKWYSEDVPEGESTRGYKAQVFAANGVAKTSVIDLVDPIVIDPLAVQPDQIKIALALGDSGEFVAVWNTGNGVDFSGVMARGFTSAGVPEGGAYHLGSGETSNPISLHKFRADISPLRIVTDGSGSYDVVWVTTRDNGEDTYINTLSRASFSFEDLSAEFVEEPGHIGVYHLGFEEDIIIPPAGEWVLGADVTMDADGESVVVWSQAPVSSLTVPRMMVQYYNSDHTVREVSVGGVPSTDPIDLGLSGLYPRIEQAMDGDITIMTAHTYNTGANEIFFLDRMGQERLDASVVPISYYGSEYGEVVVGPQGQIVSAMPSSRYLFEFNSSGDFINETTIVADDEYDPFQTYLAPLPGGRFIATYYAMPDSVSVVFTQLYEITSVVGENIFYNNSKFDGHSSGTGVADDAAIASDKVAYHPGDGTATPSNATSYSQGINGIMVDIQNAVGTITASDFTFKVGTNNSPDTWATAPTPSAVVVRAGAGVDGSDRVTITWADHDIENEWLMVVVEGDDDLGGSNTNTGLSSSEVFFYGNRMGDTFASSPSGVFLTNAADETAVRGATSSGISITNTYDFTRDGLINAADEIVARSNTGSLNRLNVPAPYPPAAPLVMTSGNSFATETLKSRTAELVAPAGDALAAVASSLAAPTKLHLSQLLPTPENLGDPGQARLPRVLQARHHVFEHTDWRLESLSQSGDSLSLLLDELDEEFDLALV